MRSPRVTANHSLLAVLVLTACASGTAQTRATTGEAPVTAPTSDAGTAPASDAGTAPASDAATPPTPSAASVTDGGAPATSAATSTTPAEPELPPMPQGLHGPPRPWARMSHRERERFMDETVMPVMSALLHAYDAQHFAEVRCSTCHGTNARQVHFHMPNSLPALPAFGTEASQRMMAEHPRMMRFMRERVTPVMTQLLGMQSYNPETHQGFGCLGCHPSAR